MEYCVNKLFKVYLLAKRGLGSFFAFLHRQNLAATFNSAVNILNLWILLFLCLQLGYYTYELKEFKRTFIVDLDLARHQFLEEARYLFVQGCDVGTDWKPSISRFGFNTNSPLFYCNEKVEKWQDYINDKAFHLGKRGVR